MFGGLKGQATSAAKGMAGQGMKDPTVRNTILYCILALLIGFGVGCTSFIATHNPQQAFLLSVCGFFLAGLLHVWVMYKLFKWAGKGALSSEGWFTLLIGVLMMAGHTTCYFMYNRGYAFLFIATSIVFLLPLVSHWLLTLAAMIPLKEYRKWFYPDKPVVADMENMDLSNFAVITFVFSKKPGDVVKSNFQSKAPYPIRLGDLFFFFLQEWNHKNPGSTIQYMDETNRPFGWHFYLKESWWKPKRYLDFDFTIRENKIGVNAIIITERVKN